MAWADTDPARPARRRADLLHDPQRWYEAKLADLQRQHRVGDALPYVRVDFGPVMLGGLLGGAVEFVSDTTWTHPFITDDWSNAPDFALREEHPCWPLLARLLSMVAEQARGRYLVCTPDLGGSGDVLLNLRGSAELCLDVVERPERIVAALRAIYPAWRRVFARLYDQTLARGAGLVHWLGLWSDRPYVIPACDFNFMIGPAEFNRLFLPDIAQQAAAVGRAVFHLDGPGAARHVEALLEIEEIRAIQFTPGSGTPSALAWVEMFRRIQARGRSVLAICPASEALALRDALRPEGLAVIVTDAGPRELDALFAEFGRPFG
jgi:hypothetical protein